MKLPPPPCAVLCYFRNNVISAQILNQYPSEMTHGIENISRRLVCHMNTSTAHGFPASCYHHLNLAGQPMQPSLFPPKIQINCISELVYDANPDIQPLYSETTCLNPGLKICKQKWPILNVYHMSWVSSHLFCTGHSSAGPVKS